MFVQGIGLHSNIARFSRTLFHPHLVIINVLTMFLSFLFFSIVKNFICHCFFIWCSSRSPFLILFQSGRYVLVKTKDHINILWDGQQDVIIKVPVSYKLSKDHKLVGMCGLYDGNSTNDFTDIQGNVYLNPTQDDIDAFADSFKQKTSCDNSLVLPVPKRPTAEILAIERDCSVIENPAFQPCHQLADYKPFFGMCMSDMYKTNYPNRQDAMCDSLALYARVCAWYHNTTLKGWRTPGLCRKQTHSIIRE